MKFTRELELTIWACMLTTSRLIARAIAQPSKKLGLGRRQGQSRAHVIAAFAAQLQMKYSVRAAFNRCSSQNGIRGRSAVIERQLRSGILWAEGRFVFWSSDSLFHNTPMGECLALSQVTC